METTFFDRNGDAVAYLLDDYNNTMFLIDGHPVAHLYEDMNIHGINGRHLGWLTDGIIFDHDGKRVGFTNHTCPKTIGKEPAKAERYYRDEIRPRWAAPPFPKLTSDFAAKDLKTFLKEGQIVEFNK
jgi:hypothetical protein